MARFKIQHITKYTYEVPVRDSANQIMLYPITDDYQQTVKHLLKVTGDPSIEVYKDIYDNKVGTFTHSRPHDELIIDSLLEVITQNRPSPDDTMPAELQWTELERIKNELFFIDFLRAENLSNLPEIQKVMDDVREKKCTPFVAAQDFCTYVFKGFTYKKGITTVDTTLDEICKLRSGVCQDFAHILLALLRLMRIPARYVSGYICPNKNGMRGEGATHAWVEAFIPFYGWMGLDPTNNCVVNENYVRLAVGKNFYDCSPVRGTYRGTSKHTLEVAVTVSYEDGHTVAATESTSDALPATFNKNSYRKHQEMQMQQ